jgi:hypothetical protein
MVKNAEQLGELKSTEKLDKLLFVGYIIAGAAVVGVIVSLLSWTTIGDLKKSFDALLPLLQGIPQLVQNTLR